MSKQATTADLFVIADHSFIREDLIKILVTLKCRFQSDQKNKWKRLRKSLYLTEFLIKNGSMDFVAYVDNRLQLLVKPFVYYEYHKNYEDHGIAIREIAKKILELCKNKDLLEREREEGNMLRIKIMGVGLTSSAKKFSNYFSDSPTKNNLKIFQSLAEEVETERIETSKKKEKKNRKTSKKSESEELSESSEAESADLTPKKKNPDNKTSTDQSSDKKKKKDDIEDLLDNCFVPKETNDEPEISKEEKVDFLS